MAGNTNMPGSVDDWTPVGANDQGNNAGGGRGLPQVLADFDAGLKATETVVLATGAATAQFLGAATADDTAAINAALASHTVVRGLPGQSYTISTPLVIRSGCTLDMTGCTVTMTGAYNAVQNQAVGTPNRTVSDAAITASSNVLTSATANFTSADIGRTVVVTGAGGTSDLPLVANITAVTNSTTATVAVNAQRTVTAAACGIYTRDADIQMLGGNWIYQSSGGSYFNAHVMRFRHVDGLRVRVEAGSSSGGKFFCAIGDATRFDVWLPNLNTASDGCHISGPASFGNVWEVTGATGDDSVAITGQDYTGYNDVMGDVTNVTVHAVHTTTPDATFKISTGVYAKARGITARSLKGTASTNAVAVVDDILGACNVSNLLIEDVHVTTTTNSAVIDISATGSTSGSVVLRSIIDPRSDSASRNIIKVGPWAKVTIDGVSVPNSPSGGAHVFNNTGTIGHLIVDNLQVSIGDTSSTNVFTFTYPVTHFSGSNHEVIGSRAYMQVSGSVVANLTNVSVTSGNRLGNLTSANLDATFSNLHADTLANAAFYTSGGTLTIRGAGVNRATAWAGFQRAASETIRCTNPDFPADLSLLAKNADDTAINTNGSLSCGTGRAISNGTAWKNIYSGATY